MLAWHRLKVSSLLTCGHGDSLLTSNGGQLATHHADERASCKDHGCFVFALEQQTKQSELQ